MFRLFPVCMADSVVSFMEPADHSLSDTLVRHVESKRCVSEVLPTAAGEATNPPVV